MLLIWVMLLVGILISVAFLVLFERKVLGYIQYRKGPNKMGVLGVLQSFADAVKLFTKNLGSILFIEKYYFLMSPMVGLSLSLFMWLVYSNMMNFCDLKFGLIIIFCCFGMGVYPLLIMGWFSSSKYSILGALRAVAQSVSYEVSLVLLFLFFIFLLKSFNFSLFESFQNFTPFFLFSFPTMILMFISFLGELNRTPFDFSEGESELVSGFNIEYMSITFSLIFLSEYSMIIFMSYLMSMLFMWTNFLFYLTLTSCIFMFVWVRGSFPRFRYDFLMFLIWKSFLVSVFIILIYSLASA